MGHKSKIQLQGVIQSILRWNSAVFITLKVATGKVKIKMPVSYCNNYKRLYVGDVIKVRGTIAKYNNKEDDVIFSVTVSKGTVQKLIGKNKPQNNRLDFNDDFNYVGTIKSAKEYDDEFYQMIFKEVGDDGDIHTIYMVKDQFEKAIDNYDFRRLHYISGKMCYISCNKYVMDLNVSYLKHYATALKPI